MRRCKDERAVLEGPHLVEEAFTAGLDLEEVLVTPDFLASGSGRRLEPRLPVAPTVVAPGVLDDVADADSPRGVLAVVRLPRERVDRLPLAAGGLYLYADGVQDPGNLGAVARVLEAAGGTALACAAGCVHPNHPRALRASAGSLLRLPVAREVEPGNLEEHLRPLTPRWLGLAAHEGRSLWEEPLEGALVVVLGSEAHGLSAGARRVVHGFVHVPMAPPVESLNVVVATALLLFERRRRAA